LSSDDDNLTSPRRKNSFDAMVEEKKVSNAAANKNANRLSRIGCVMHTIRTKDMNLSDRRSTQQVMKSGPGGLLSTFDAGLFSNSTVNVSGMPAEEEKI